MIKFKQIGRSFQFAWRGFRHVFGQEQNFRIQLLTGLVVIVLIFLLGISLLESAVLILAISLVLTLELINTAIERMTDMVKPRLHHYVEVIKDVTAAAVFFASLAAAVVGLLIILPYLSNFSLM